MTRLADVDALLAAYDAVHEGPPGKARELIEHAPTVDAIPMKWLERKRDSELKNALKSTPDYGKSDLAFSIHMVLKAWKEDVCHDAPPCHVIDEAGANVRIFLKPVEFKQEDARWGKKVYSNHNDKHQTMAASGSGPTLCASVVATLKDRSVNPWTLAQLAMEWGCRTYSCGTSWDFFQKAAQHYKFKKYVCSRRFESLVECLDAGGYVICSMSKGYWTQNGNFILAWKYDCRHVYCIMAQRSYRVKQKIEDFKSESKVYFCFYPD